MASLLRQIVASPRARHPEAGLDLCYVTDTVIATSGPGSTYPQVAYRNPLKELVKFLDDKHGADWAIWEFRAEGTGYPDDEVYNRIRHYPWPDHHPPPFALIPLIMGSMRNWLKGKGREGKEDGKEEHTKDGKLGRVAVLHCKAGKGRSGTVACSYMISEEGWDAEEAKKRFTERRMRPGFGNGISIPSQVRTITYVDRWAKHGKIYVERPVEILELHIWGLRDGVKIAIEGYVEEGKVIKTFHTLKSTERENVRGSIKKESGLADVAFEVMGRGKRKSTILEPSPVPKSQAPAEEDAEKALKEAEQENAGVKRSDTDELADNTGDVIFRPSSRVVLPSSDVNIDFERRNRSRYGGFTMVTSVAHVWFNCFFEGKGPEQNGQPDDSGVFEIEWDALDGIKGSSRKGTRAFDKMAVVWKAVVVEPDRPAVVIREPGEDEEVQQARPADWRGAHDGQSQDIEKKLGLRAETSESAAVSRASSVRSKMGATETAGSPTEGTRPHIPDIPAASAAATDNKGSGQNGRGVNPTQVDGVLAGLDDKMHHLSTAQLPDGKPEKEMENRKRAPVGSIHFGKMDGDMAS